MKSGFSFIEFIIYLMAFSCIVTLTLQSVVKLVQNVRSCSQSTHQTLQLYTALDVIAHELENAPFKGTQWYEKGVHNCIWYCKQKNKTISLKYEDKKISKITGTYDNNQKKWLSKISNILVDNLDHCQFSYNMDHREDKEYVKSLMVILKTKNKNIEKKVYFKNGYLA